MADIEPYKQIQKTNVQEHNDLVGKINEIIEVINQTNLDTIIPKITKLEQDVSEITANDSVQDNDISSLKTKTAKLEQDVSGINATDSLQWNDIESMKTDINTINPKISKLEQDITTINGVDTSQSNDIDSIKAKNTEQDSTLATHANQIDGITKSLVSDVVLMNGTTAGNMKVRIERESAPSIDSDDYNIQKPTSVELVQGSAPAMVKAQITLSDGTVLVSDDFMFTTEAIGQDVYISSFVFKNGNVAGTISADIGLSNGSTLTANNFAVPTDPNVTTAISDLQGKVTTVENDVSGLKTTVSGHTTSINNLDSDVSDLQTRITAVEGDASGFDALKVTVDGHTASISALDSDVADLQVDKADADNSTQTINAGTINATNIKKNGVAVATTNDIPDISGKVNIAQGTVNAGKVLGINASGNVEPTKISSGGEVWEEVDLNNFPTNWVKGDQIRLITKLSCNDKGAIATNDYWSPVIHFYIDSSESRPAVLYNTPTATYCCGMKNFNDINGTYSVHSIAVFYYNPTSGTNKEVRLTRTNLPNYTDKIKMWRLKK